jgi:hypothetical protein
MGKMSNQDVWARFLIANGLASPGDYQRLLGEYENLGLCAHLPPLLKTQTAHIGLAKKPQTKPVGLADFSNDKESGPKNPLKGSY